jgi:cytochrome b561
MTQSRYSPPARLLHWAVAGMIVLQFILAKLADRVGETSELFLLANHRSVGMTILAVAILRLIVRLRVPAPPALAMPDWQKKASEISHWLLYALLFLLPITGWLMSSASAYSFSWFNLIQIPDLVSPDPQLKEVLEEVHETFAKILLLLAGLHIAAAIKHTVINRDGAMNRITSKISIAVFAAVIVLGVFILSRVPEGAATDANSASEPELVPAALPQSGLAPCKIDHSSSYIRFTADQAGAEFAGEWQLWSADLRFDEGNLQASTFDVNVIVTSVETQDDDRDLTLQDPDWFDSANYPEVFYQA